MTTTKPRDPEPRRTTSRGCTWQTHRLCALRGPKRGLSAGAQNPTPDVAVPPEVLFHDTGQPTTEQRRNKTNNVGRKWTPPTCRRKPSARSTSQRVALRPIQYTKVPTTFTNTSSPASNWHRNMCHSALRGSAPASAPP